MTAKKFSRDHSLIVFYKKNGKILFQDRTSKKEKNGVKFGFFGGGVDEGETFLQACLRETKEELNLDLQENNVVEVARFSKTISGVGHSENVIFISLWRENYSKDLQILEGDAGVWMSLDDAKKEIFFNHDYMVFDLLERYFERHNIFI